MEFRHVVYNHTMPKDGTYVLAADIGGTNANFGIFLEQNKNLVLVLSVHYKSQHITQFTDVIHHLEHFLKSTYTIAMHKACIAAAGVISANRDWVKPTNLNIEISVAELIAKTNLSCVYLANDFEVIGHGIDVLDVQSLVQVHGVAGRPYATKAIIGAGTGLGKSFLIWHESKKRYMPVLSEGGHADIPLLNQVEWALHDFMINQVGLVSPLSWEHFLSGAGIKRIHRYFSEKHNSEIEQEVHPDQIFDNREQDIACKNTFELYAQLYGRCAKNTVLETLALGGLYIAGGIAAKNIQMFRTALFLDAFLNTQTHQTLLADIPLIIVADYNVSLYGAAQYLLLEKVCGN